MNNYCRNCGSKIDSDSKICNKCSAEVFEKRVNPELKKEEIENYKKKEKKYIKIILICFAIGYLFPIITYVLNNLLNFYIDLSILSIFSIVVSFVKLSSIIVLIYARVTMPGSKSIRIIFNIFIILYLILLIGALLFSVTCIGVIGHYNGKW